MAQSDVYALNTVSGVVQKIRPELLDHPTFRDHLIEVDSPNACIECGDQPDSVTTTLGEVIDLTNEAFEEDLEADPEEEIE